MATPLVNTISLRGHALMYVGSGSQPTAHALLELGEPTSIAACDWVLYFFTDLLRPAASQTCAVAPLRLPQANPVGNWLFGTEGMLAEAESGPLGAYARALDELKSDLGVTLTYIARCLGLQRSAIYKWYEGARPHAANRSRLETVREFATAWRTARLPSLRLYWDARVPGANATLGELLSAEALDVTGMRAAIDTFTAGKAAAPTKSRPLGFPSRKRDRKKDRERLSVLTPPTSHEDEEG